jgi:putative DNA primase/helicase
MTTESSCLAAALAAHAAGIAVLPPREDGSKSPITNEHGEWAVKGERADERQIRGWYGPRTGLGVICGKISNGLEALDFDLRAVCDAFVAAAQDWGLAALVAHIRAGYDELTPNGQHWLYYCAENACVKLAERPAPTQGNPRGRKTLIETKGEGGYAIIAPSRGRVHPSGYAYELVSGSFGTITAISPAERQSLFALARSFDQMPRAERQQAPPRSWAPSPGDRPGDLQIAHWSWAEILEPHGWTWVYGRGGISYWRRPGKDHGISATTNATGRDTLIVFSSSTLFDTAPASYDRFGAYAVLEHGGDFHAAAVHLAKRFALGRPRVVPIESIDPSVLKHHYE